MYQDNYAASDCIKMFTWQENLANLHHKLCLDV